MRIIFKIDDTILNLIHSHRNKFKSCRVISVEEDVFTVEYHNGEIETFNKNSLGYLEKIKGD